MTRLTTIMAMILLATVLSVSAAIIQEEGKAAYYGTVDEALQAANDDQLVLVKFETEW